MSAGWVAGTVRARAMARRRIGAAGARGLAASPSLDVALAGLLGTPYGHDIRSGQTLAQAQRAVAETLLWNLRVLAGWLPRDGGDRLRVLAGWFELANLDEQLRAFAGQPAEPPFAMGGLASAGSRIADAGSPAELRHVLATSPWGDPGGETAREVQPGTRLGWAERVVASVPPAASWALGAATLLVAREHLVAGRRLPATAMATARRVLGSAAPEATSIAALGAALGRQAGWALVGVDEPDALWRAETGWWARVESDAFGLLRRPRFGLEPVVGAVAAAAVDAWRVRAALEIAARGGLPSEAFDAVA